ncbi:MAG: aminopeptidase P family protein [Clostridia bacterium]|nr:aminopeptidase P family protein [Clostridia bacterium]
MVKSKEEIEKLRKAALLADECFEYICNTIKIGMSEKEIASLMDSYMLSNGATGLSFETIVGSGVNSAQIHSTPTDRKIEYGDIILLDFGCIVDKYCSDISRTIFIGEIKKEYKEIYDIVLKSQLTGIEKIEPGMTAKNADLICRNVIKDAGYDFNHAVGHGVGTEVHEEPVISPKREDVVLQNDMVFTIEPGIYMENKFGVRIEDTVVLNNGRVEPLNKASKEIIIIK